MKLDEGACVYGAGVLLKHLNALEKEIAGVSAGGEDTDPVHDARVASRRLRATIPLFIDCLPSKKAKKWLKDIREVTRALGAARDTDVQLEWMEKFQKKLPEKVYLPGINRLIMRLRQKREKLQAPLITAMEKLSGSRLLVVMAEALQPAACRAEEIYVYTPALYQHSHQSISGRLETLLSFDAIVDQPDKVTELHEMRIAAKWLRYTTETFAPLYADQLQTCLQAVRSSQDLLGEIHDCDVWQLFLASFREEERQRTLEYFGSERPYKRLDAGIMYLQQDRLQERGQLYQQFVTNWHAWMSAGLWNDLRRTIQVPFLQPGQVYPPLNPRREEPSAS